MPGLANYDMYTSSFQAYGQYAGAYITATSYHNGTSQYCGVSRNARLFAVDSLSSLFTVLGSGLATTEPSYCSTTPTPPLPRGRFTLILFPDDAIHSPTQLTGPPGGPLPVEQQGYIGCGYGRVTDTQLLGNVSFMWAGVTNGTAMPQYVLVNGSDAVNGNQYQHMAMLSGEGRVGLANYGVDCQLGLYLVGGNTYEGHLYARASTATTLYVSLEDYELPDYMLDVVTLTVPGSGQWQRLNFTLTPSQNTTCSASQQAVLGVVQSVYACSGRFVVAVNEPGAAVDTDMVSGSSSMMQLCGHVRTGVSEPRQLGHRGCTHSWWYWTARAQGRGGADAGPAAQDHPHCALSDDVMAR